jgi:adenylosuccinate synthase
MPNRVVVGAQWGDEGKGKIVDLLAEEADVIARYQGGANAGHTVVYKNQKFILHLIPSGILRPKKVCIIGSGVVVDLGSLLEELAELKKLGVKPEGRLWISLGAHLVMPYHKIWEQQEEERRGKDKIGTTLRGIGPAYEDKTGRRGIRVCDLWYDEKFSRKVDDNLKFYASVGRFSSQNGIPSKAELINSVLKLRDRVKDFVADTSVILNEAIRKKKSLLLEGAQGTLLDLDFGTYPYNTSSNTTAGGACTGLGIGPTVIDEVIGVAKAYTTRVGNGPFPTELNDSLGEYLRRKGDEFGATTRRPRRCGWLDMLILKYAVRVNGISKLAITKLDVLDEMPEIKVAVAYKYKGKILKEFPQDTNILEQLTPIYKTLPGWKASTSGLTSWKKLPANARKYIDFIAGSLGAKILLVSTGCGREETVWLK